ncbi:hypothetical protein E3Q22_04413 [Wallemia mellicola]|uniref:Uncharacterized protein n=1 Tax=Wallemia mellicola TaxID=1708541 RepID=A0A4V4MEM3_9BASI|nr:hypothetical protein E3Q22_04413 [Wallemia mellicola]
MDGHDKKLTHFPGKAGNHSNEFRGAEFIGGDILKHISFHSNEVDTRGSFNASQNKKRQDRRRDTNRNKRWEPYNEDHTMLASDSSPLAEQFNEALLEAAEQIGRHVTNNLNEYLYKKHGLCDQIKQSLRDIKEEIVTLDDSHTASKYTDKASRVSPVVSSNKDITNIPYQGDTIKPIISETEKISEEMKRFIEERIANAELYHQYFLWYVNSNSESNYAGPFFE